MKHPKKPFKLDLMSALLIVVSLGVALTMIAQAGEKAPSAQMGFSDSVTVAYQTSDVLSVSVIR